jgi:hypothetical protein
MDDDLLDDLGYHLAVAEPTERRQLFLAMAAKHPDLAADLADLLVELALDDLREPDRVEPCVPPGDPSVIRAMERFRAALSRQR